MPITLSVIDYLAMHRARISLIPYVLHFRGVLVGIFRGSAPLGSRSPYLILDSFYSKCIILFQVYFPFQTCSFRSTPYFHRRSRNRRSSLLFCLFTHYCRLLIETKIIPKNISFLLTFKRKTSLKKAKSVSSPIVFYTPI